MPVMLDIHNRKKNIPQPLFIFPMPPEQERIPVAGLGLVVPLIAVERKSRWAVLAGLDSWWNQVTGLMPKRFSSHPGCGRCHVASQSNRNLSSPCVGVEW